MDDCRKAFEEWISPFPSDIPDNIKKMVTQAGWEAFHAGWHHPNRYKHREDRQCDHPAGELISSTQGFACKLCGQVI